MKRIELGGDSLVDFPDDALGGYVKLLLPKSGDIEPGDPEAVDLAAFVKRSYTVRAFDREERRLTLDLMVCADKGPATTWASDAEPGDEILVAGPGPVKLVDPGADWFLLAGDMTALPAIAVNLERLPASARGYVVIEVVSTDDIPELEIPSGVQPTWLVNPTTATDSPIADHVRSLPWLDGRASVWSASEFATMRALRAYFRERGVTSSQMYLSSYWKRHATDEEHKQAKRADADTGA